MGARVKIQTQLGTEARPKVCVEADKEKEREQIFQRASAFLHFCMYGRRLSESFFMKDLQPAGPKRDPQALDITHRHWGFQFKEQTGGDLQAVTVSSIVLRKVGWYLLCPSKLSTAPCNRRLTSKDYMRDSQTFESQDSHNLTTIEDSK